jgi:hypothetical protein
MPAWSLAAPEWVYRFRRLRRAERMDEKGLPAWEREAALQGLEEISTWWGQRQPLLKAVLELLGPPNTKRLRLVEVGAGSGHTARWMSGELLKRGYRAEVLATDLHPIRPPHREYGWGGSRPAPTIFPGVGVRRLDALRGRLPDADLYYSNLFLHHLPDAALPQLFARQARASRLGFVHYDLQRHWAHFYGASLRLRWAGLPRINWTDGLRSIQQGYTRADLSALAAAGVAGVRLRWCLPCRWMLTWKRL